MMVAGRCKSQNPDSKGDDLLGCELDENHYGVHMVFQENGDASVWYRNWIDLNIDKDTFRMPITEDDQTPERHASMDEMLDLRKRL